MFWYYLASGEMSEEVPATYRHKDLEGQYVYSSPEARSVHQFAPMVGLNFVFVSDQQNESNPSIGDESVPTLPPMTWLDLNAFATTTDTPPIAMTFLQS